MSIQNLIDFKILNKRRSIFMENQMPPLENDELKKAIKGLHENYNQESLWTKAM